VGFTGASTLSAGTDQSIAIGSGNLSTYGVTQVTAGNNLVIGIGQGHVSLNQQTTFAGMGNVSMTVGAGNIALNESATLTAANVLSVLITQSGALTMADADTLLNAGNLVTVSTVGDIRLDLVTAGNAVELTSTQGGIFDNTAAETELILAPTLTFSAYAGVGVPWVDNLNVNASTISALNTNRAGINLQNTNGFTVGQLGIVNRGSGDVILIAGGPIVQTASVYGTSVPTAGSVNNLTGQKIYLKGNQSPSDLASQLGNRTAALISTQIRQPDRFEMSQLNLNTMLTPIDSRVSMDAFDRLLEQDIQSQDAASPTQAIRLNWLLNQASNQSVNGRILEAFGLSNPLDAFQSTRGRLQQSIDELRAELEKMDTSPVLEGEFVSPIPSPKGNELASSWSYLDPSNEPLIAEVQIVALRDNMQRILSLADDDLDAPIVPESLRSFAD
jgi:hypothetical protein